jgi:hypothetical protein
LPAQLNRLLSLPYTTTEEAVVIDYCKKNVNHLTQDFLVIFFLVRNRRIEALRMHAELERKDPRFNQGTATPTPRHVMMDNLRATLLDVEKQLVGDLADGLKLGEAPNAFILPPRTPSRDLLRRYNLSLFS